MAAKTATATPWVDIIYSVYLALVCAVSLLVSVILVGSLINNGLDWAMPRPNYIDPVVYSPGSEAPRPMTEAELSVRQKQEARNQHINAVRQTTHSAIYLLLTAGVYFSHRRLFRSRVGRGK
ncbi:MAG TPA: hypothetical protein VHP58_04675 [Alphaproteobacteria bacterium]|nr:hypothetical protein [Alphaproteobacteria bacterium]